MIDSEQKINNEARQVKVAKGVKEAVEDEATRLSRLENKRVTEGDVIARALASYRANQPSSPKATFSNKEIPAHLLPEPERENVKMFTPATPQNGDNLHLSEPIQGGQEAEWRDYFERIINDLGQVLGKVDGLERAYLDDAETRRNSEVMRQADGHLSAAKEAVSASGKLDGVGAPHKPDAGGAGSGTGSAPKKTGGKKRNVA